MKTGLLSLFAGTALMAAVAAQAGEVVSLTEAQLDGVTAGNPCEGSGNTCTASNYVSISQKNKNETYQWAGNYSGDGSNNNNSGNNTNTNTTYQSNYASVSATAYITGP
jgi:hypothetical protein